jgi:hypothetical protein
MQPASKKVRKKQTVIYFVCIQFDLWYSSGCYSIATITAQTATAASAIFGSTCVLIIIAILSSFSYLIIYVKL